MDISYVTVFLCQSRVACFLPCSEANKLSPQKGFTLGLAEGLTLVKVELFLFTLLKVTGVTCLLKTNKQTSYPAHAPR